MEDDGSEAWIISSEEEELDLELESEDVDENSHTKSFNNSKTHQPSSAESDITQDAVNSSVNEDEEEDILSDDGTLDNDSTFAYSEDEDEDAGSEDDYEAYVDMFSDTEAQGMEGFIEKIPEEVRMRQDILREVFQVPLYLTNEQKQEMAGMMPKYAFTQDYSGMAGEMNESGPYKIQRHRYFKEVDMAYHMAMVDDVYRYYKNEGFTINEFKMAPNRARVATERELQLEEAQADYLNKLEEGDIHRGLFNRSANLKLFKYIFNPYTFDYLNTSMIGDEEAFVSIPARKTYMRLLVDWLRRVVRDALCIEEERCFVRGQHGEGRKQVTPDSVEVALELNGVRGVTVAHHRRNRVWSEEQWEAYRKSDPVDYEFCKKSTKLCGLPPKVPEKRKKNIVNLKVEPDDTSDVDIT